jgi:glycosyltransferase involved in cell wall biosynthesis
MVSVSVVMPVYNGAPRVAETMESILGQTLTDFELIVVDDGSTDATPDLLDRYLEQDKRVRVIRQDNAGITSALITGCAAATAALIARQDCGDRSHLERLERQQKLFRKTDCVLSGCATAYFAPGGEWLYTVAPSGEEVRRSLIGDSLKAIRGLPHHGSAMFRRDAYEQAGGYRSDFYFAQDLDLCMRLAKCGSVCITPETLYDARVELGTISSRQRREQMASARLAIAIRDGGSAPELLARARAIRPAPRAKKERRLESKALYFIASCLRSNGDPAWRRYLVQSLRRNPLQLRGWLLPARRRRKQQPG